MMTYQDSGDKRHSCTHCGVGRGVHPIDDDGDRCDPADARRHAANVKRRAKNRARSAAVRDALDSIAVKRVRGNLGGVYYE